MAQRAGGGRQGGVRVPRAGCAVGGDGRWSCWTPRRCSRRRSPRASEALSRYVGLAARGRAARCARRAAAGSGRRGAARAVRGDGVAGRGCGGPTASNRRRSSDTPRARSRRRTWRAGCRWTMRRGSSRCAAARCASGWPAVAGWCPSRCRSTGSRSGSSRTAVACRSRPSTVPRRWSYPASPASWTSCWPHASGTGSRARRVPVDYASHTVQVEAIEDELLQTLAPIAPRSGQVPFYSTTDGQFLDTAKLDAAYW